MYEQWWKFSEAPFAQNNNPRWFVSSEANEETLARLEFLVDRDRRFGILTGDGGTGKSFLLQYVRNCLVAPGIPVPCLDLCGRPYMDVLRELASSLCGEVDGSESEFVLWRSVLDELKGHSLSSARSVLLFDHLDQAGPGGLQVVERLLSLHGQTGGGFTIIATSRQAVPASLRQVSDLWMQLSSLTLEDTRNYIKTRVQLAGGDKDTFGPDGIVRVFAESMGNPRTINQIAEMSLLEGAAQQAPCITNEIVETATRQCFVGNRAA